MSSTLRRRRGADLPTRDVHNRLELIDFRIAGSLVRERGQGSLLGRPILPEEADVAHINVTVPDELLAEAKERGICFSQLLQRSIREVVNCTHDDELTCERCGESIDRHTIAFAALKRFCGDVMWELDVAVSRGVTGEGAARIVKSVAERHDAAVGAAAAERHQGLATAMGPLPRPSRAARQAWRDRDDEVNYDTTRRRAS